VLVMIADVSTVKGGSAVRWGNNANGELGIGGIGTNKGSNVPVVLIGMGVA
jgi:hypothetical protein